MVITTRRWNGPAAGAWTALLLGVLTPVRGGAADWTFTPGLRLRESYTDNVRLESSQLAKDDLVSEIAPTLLVTADGPRLKLDFDYALHKVIYTRQPDSLDHQLAASANAVLVDDWLFSDAHASVGRHNISPFGPQTVDDLPRTANQSSVHSTSISPYLRHHFRGLATAELRYTHERFGSGDALLTTNTDELQLQLNGDSRGRGWNWDARYERRRVDDNALAPVLSSTSTLGLHYPLTSRLRLNASGGYERQGYSALGEPPQSRFWSLGAGWNPSARSSFAFSAGRRFFGNTYALDARHSSRRLNWSFNYNEDITSTPGQFGRLNSDATASLLDQLWTASVPDPVLRRQRVAAFLLLSRLLGPDLGAVNYFSHRYFLQRQASLSLAAVGAKSTLAFGLTATRSTAQTSSQVDNRLLPALDLSFEDRTRQIGANAGWNWRLSPRTGVNSAAAYTRADSLTSGRSDRNLALSVGLTRALRPKVNGALDLRHVLHTSNQGGGYRENAIAATLIFQL